jgi:hypothetical protein
VGADGIVASADRIERSARSLVLDGVANDVDELTLELERFAATQARDPRE